MSISLPIETHLYQRKIVMYSINAIKAKSIPLSITQTALETALQFARLQPTLEKRCQVYYNTLAVCVVNDYMQMLGIDTDLSASDSWNQVLHLVADVADLMLPGLGRLECRSVTPESLQSNTPICYIPPEVPDDQIGIVVVEIDPELQQATLLGFSPTVPTTELAINQLQTMDDLLDRLEDIKTENIPILVTQLSQWLQKQFAAGWQSLESLLSTQKVEMALNFRAPASTVERAKLIELGSRPMVKTILVVEITPTSTPEMNITVGMRPAVDQTYLPEYLQVAIVDADGASVMEVSANSANKNMQLQFCSEPQEEFSVKVTLGDTSVIEKFVV